MNKLYEQKHVFKVLQKMRNVDVAFTFLHVFVNFLKYVEFKINK